MSEDDRKKYLKKAKKMLKKMKKKKMNIKAGSTKIADIQFSYRNHELIGALRNRGYAIAANDFDKMRD